MSDSVITLRISTSENYWHKRCEIFRDCERFYCNIHRLLYRLCDVVRQEEEGDRDVVNGTRTFWASDGECPECERRARQLKLEREIVASAWHEPTKQ